MDSDEAHVDVLLLLLYLMHEIRRLEDENKELHALLNVEYREAGQARKRLRAFRHPVSND